jgi:large subunit ribosomal protein L14e
MPYTRFVEVGRLVLISFGPLADKIGIIVDVIDANRVVIDVPNSTEPRQVIPIKRLKLTNIVVKIERAAPPEAVAEAINTENALGHWGETKWAQRIAMRQAKAGLNDFQRFKYARLVEKRDDLIKANAAKRQGGKKKK